MTSSDRFLLIGVGGAGGRIANSIAQSTAGRLKAVAIDTDFEAVAKLGLCQQIRVGRSRFDGLGSGGNVTAVRMAADEEAETIRKLLDDTTLALVVTGLGGGTGSGATPAVLKAARSLNIRTLTFATMPFDFEETERQQLAKRTCLLLEEAGDVIVTAANQDLCSNSFDLPAIEAFAAATNHLAAGLLLLWQLVNCSGYIRIDYAMLANLLLGGRGRATFGFASADGPQRFELALANLLDDPHLGVRSGLQKIPAMLVGILGGEDLRLKEIGDVMARLKMELPPDCDLRMGTVMDPALDSTLSLATLLFHSWTPSDAADILIESASTTKDPADAPRLASRGRRTGKAVNNLAGDRFKSTHATIYGGEDLDVPTFMRRSLRIDSN